MGKLIKGVCTSVQGQSQQTSLYRLEAKQTLYVIDFKMWYKRLCIRVYNNRSTDLKKFKVDKNLSPKRCFPFFWGQAVISGGKHLLLYLYFLFFFFRICWDFTCINNIGLLKISTIRDTGFLKVIFVDLGFPKSEILLVPTI